MQHKSQSLQRPKPTLCGRRRPELPATIAKNAKKQSEFTNILELLLQWFYYKYVVLK